MRGLFRRFRMLLPPTGFVIGYVAFYLVGSLPLIVQANLLGGGVVDPKLRQTPALIQFAGVLLYGMFRAYSFHPYFRAGYRQWLETTPWSWGKPLPVGPAHPVWEDLVIVAAAGLPEWLSGDVSPAATYSVAVGGYLAVLSMTFARAGAWGFQYPVLFGLGLALRLWSYRPEFYGGVALASYLIGMAGLRRSFRSWPWSDIPAMTVDPNKPIDSHGKPPNLGWPFDRLGPRPEPTPGRHEGLGTLLGAALVGWWCYALEHVVREPNGQSFLMRGIIFNMVLMLAAIRTSVMLTGYAPPISLGGRIGRLRPLIPSYDRAFVSPIAAVFFASAGPSFMERAGLPVDVAVAACAGLSLATLWLGGPDRRIWQLTARHRVTAGIPASSNKLGEFVQTG